MRAGTLLVTGCAACLALAAAAPAAGQAQDTARAAVERVLGRPGAAQPGNVARFSFPRGDLHVAVDGVPLRPALALGSWVAFLPLGDGTAMAMGDLVLTDEEVAPVISRLQQGGVEPAAVHNHLLRESPRVVYVHVQAHGDPVRIARTVRAALALTRTPLGPPAPQAATTPFGLDTAAMAHALGHGGRVTGGVYQVSVPRADTVRDGGHVIPPSMGVATAINFQPTGGGRAAITGDFVMIASEVGPVARALRENGIEVTALHSHMLGEEPRLYFMHFWANDDAVKLATGLHAALARMSVR